MSGDTARGNNKRPPWLTAEDARMLMALDPPARREMSNLLHRQYREQLRYEQLCSRLIGQRTAAALGRSGAGGVTF